MMVPDKYAKQALVFKALAEPNRLKIIKMLSQGEHCACEILESLQITQPTLSHHMKILIECELVVGRKEGIWMHYSLNKAKYDELIAYVFWLIEK